jgi:hypothetical protein
MMKLLLGLILFITPALCGESRRDGTPAELLNEAKC